MCVWRAGPACSDGQVHFSTWTASQRQISLAGLTSLDAVVAAVGHALDARGTAHRGEVLSGYGLQLASWTDDDLARMTAATLDAAFPDAGPIALFLGTPFIAVTLTRQSICTPAASTRQCSRCAI